MRARRGPTSSSPPIDAPICEQCQADIARDEMMRREAEAEGETIHVLDTFARSLADSNAHEVICACGAKAECDSRAAAELWWSAHRAAAHDEARGPVIAGGAGCGCRLPPHSNANPCPDSIDEGAKGAAAKGMCLWCAPHPRTRALQPERAIESRSAGPASAIIAAATTRRRPPTGACTSTSVPDTAARRCRSVRYDPPRAAR